MYNIFLYQKKLQCVISQHRSLKHMLNKEGPSREPRRPPDRATKGEEKSVEKYT